MSLEQVEARLGPGRLLEAEEIPQTPTYAVSEKAAKFRPVIIGAKVYRWELDSLTIFVGFDSGQLCDKWCK
jgi:hypothetical protein